VVFPSGFFLAEKNQREEKNQRIRSLTSFEINSAKSAKGGQVSLKKIKKMLKKNILWVHHPHTQSPQGAFIYYMSPVRLSQ